ncbi:MAG: Thymidylate kinase [Candidatus Saccharibacteria bacterium]|nr:Thymidylate kinase [Candidatus Saccharibacteria bacterium]
MGLFIALEGGDGSGKGTQAALLEQYFQAQGKHVLHVSFPRHGEFSAIYVQKYLNGEYGAADDVPGDLASLPYAFDRYAASSEMRTVLENASGIVIADRYVASNLAHQGTKFSNADDRKSFYERMMKTEYEVLGIPKPDINIVLVVPTHIAQSNVDKKAVRSYTTKKRDIHEADASHLERAKANYEELTRLYPDKFLAINCTVNDTSMRSITSIHTELLEKIKMAR